MGETFMAQINCRYILKQGINKGMVCGKLRKKCKNQLHIHYRKVEFSINFKKENPYIPIMADGLKINLWAINKEQ